MTELLVSGGLLIGVLVAVGKFARDFINRQQSFFENHVAHHTQALVDLKNAVQTNTAVGREILTYLRAHDA